jgi:cell division protein FtsZ
LEAVDKKLSLIEAFKVADSVLGHGVKGISDIITVPGLINVDFADVKAIMNEAGSALMGIGVGVGENRAQLAARQATSSPLLEVSMEGARGVLFNITGGADMTMQEVEDASRVISKSADPDANIIFGAAINEELKDEIRITLIATGFDESRVRLQQMVEDTVEMQGGANNNNDSRDEYRNNEDEGTHERKNDDDEDIFEIPAFLRQKN